MKCRLIVETPPSHLTGVLHVMHSFGCSAFDVLSNEQCNEVESATARLFVSANAQAEVRRHLEKELERVLGGTGSVTVLETAIIQ
ncbi:MAG: hypothetical protein JSR78_03120 [Proteobacteria bacterium]|nr:hypothetical protein [Pseudomonadota bacterium]